MLFTEASHHDLMLMTSDYCLRETEHNLAKLGSIAEDEWRAAIKPKLVHISTQLVLDRPLVYRAVKDRPVIISALSHQADVLLTLDREDFHGLLGQVVYGLPIQTPASFLRHL